MNQDLRAAYRILSQLEKSKSLSDEIFDGLPGVHVIIGSDGRIFRSNAATAMLFGQNPEDVLGLEIQNIFAQQSRRSLVDHFEAIASGKESRLEFEAAAIDLQGKEHPYHWEINRLPIKGNHKHTLLSMIGRDVSELKKALRSVLELEKDLDVARAVQSLILPEVDQLNTPDWAMIAHYEPAAQAGGDWWRCDPRPDGSALFLLGDVMGHGAGAGMVTAMVAGAYSTHTSQHGTTDVPSLFHELNRQLTALRGQSYWMTLLALDVRPEEQKLSWYCAAAPPALLVKASGDIMELGDQGAPLGSGALQFSSGECEFHSGDRLFCATDGLFEVSPDISATALKRRLTKVLKGNWPCLPDLREAIIKDWARWLSSDTLHDDVAFLIIDRLATSTASQPSS